MNIVLKACPFCGYALDPAEPDVIYPINRERTMWNVVCPSACGGCDAYVIAGTAEEAIEKWNRRVHT